MLHEPGRIAPCKTPLRDARVLYVSATSARDGAGPRLCGRRLGLWKRTGDFPFATRADFVSAMEGGGIAAMEVLARDLKALGLLRRALVSFERHRVRPTSSASCRPSESAFTATPMPTLSRSSQSLNEAR